LSYNTGARSCNHCCSGKALSISHCGLVFVALGIQHGMCMRHNPLCGLSGSVIFLHIISQTAQLKKKSLLNAKRAFWFSLQIFLTFLIVRRTQRKRSNSYTGLHVKYPFFSSELNFLERISNNSQISIPYFNQ
jgi:hypothetical protein